MTEYLAWYRKYRPQTFDQVVGQTHIVSVLKQAVTAGTPRQAYLFIGSRGTGKTSIARILAKTLQVADKDIIEIDAASNTGVDDIRALQEDIYSLPFASSYKVYIIDEAHMLSKSAFNALLKTLEEPPSHVIFILATTEAEKMPETVKSRCETHIFRQPTALELKTVISQTAKAEKLKLPTGADDLIAELANGSFRDALGLLQQVAADKKITLAEIQELTGAPGIELLNKLAQALLDNDSSTAIDLINQARQSQVDIRLLTKLLTQLIRQATLYSLTKNTIPDDRWFSPETVKNLANNPRQKYLPAILKMLVRAWDNQAWLFDPGLPLELVVLEIAEQDNK
ncbi:MAG: DNA polymerase III subunit gamma/tau [Patescibacteria group bacterium]